jgi:hypothetical protein
MEDRTELSIEGRLADQIDRLRAAAEILPSGPERSDLLKQAEKAEVSLALIRWIASPSLRPPPDNLIPIRRFWLK